MLRITSHIEISETEFDFSFARSGGPGGQNVNKVSSAIHLRFNVCSSSLPDVYKQRLLNLKDRRLSRDGEIIIKAQRFRTQEKNRSDALDRLVEIIKGVTTISKKRIATKPSRRSRQKRVDSKTHRGKLKQSRQKTIE